MAEPTRVPESRDDGASGGDEPRIPEEQRLQGAIPPEPNSADEAAEATTVTPRTGRTREGRAATDASGMGVDDERRGERRKQDAARGASEISEID